MSTIINSKQVGNYTINIEYDECTESPREWGEDWEKMAKQYMKGCVDDYSQWANGQVYVYDILAKNGEIVDSCGGYYDADEAMAVAAGIAEQYNADDKDRIEKTLESASLQELKELFYEFATPAPTWADELFELADESKAKEWLKTKLKEIVPTDEWMEIV